MAVNKQKRELPAKDGALFKQILRLYEHKQYKRGLKTADQLLKKYPEHGETLAMKGLFLSHMDQKEEAYDYVKKGLKCDLFSAICWHVYGLLYRSDKNYEEAVKCYRHALKYDKENIQVLRDFSFLQVQMRDYDGFNETQHELLRLRPAQRVYWFGLAISYQLLGKLDTAVKLLDAYQETAKDREEGSIDYEHSEMLMYQCTVMEEMGDLEGCLGHLTKSEDQICDKFNLLEKKANVLLKLGRNAEAETIFRELLSRNPDNISYFNGLSETKGLATDDTKRFNLILSLIDTYPKSYLLKSLALVYAPDDDTFRVQLDIYLKLMLRKNVPSLFIILKRHYSIPSRVRIIQDLVESYLKNLEHSGSFDGNPTDDRENPSVILFVLYFLAQHWDMLKDYEKSLCLIDQAIDHTPTLLELLMFKARTLKHAGNYELASQWMDSARKLDLQDRFINTKATKYFLRADKVKEAQDTIGLFTKQGTMEEKMHDLVEMQCMWFALEIAASSARQKNFGFALKRFHQVHKHFEEITDDQFDFHPYCLRKLTLRAYISLLRFEDRLHSREYFVKAAEGAVQIYIALFDDPSLKSNVCSSEDLTKLSESERKKLLSKQRRAAARELNQTDSKDKKPSAVKDDDPNGEKFLNADMLASAAKFLEPLQEQGQGLLTTHILSFEVFFRQKKYLLALKSLKQALNIDPDHHDTHYCFIRFWNRASSLNKDTLSSVAQTLIAEEQNSIALFTNGVFSGLENLNKSYMQKAEEVGQTNRYLSACRSLKLLHPDQEERSYELMANILIRPTFTNGACPVTSKICEVVFEELKNTKYLGQFIDACKRRFPLAEKFLTPEEITATAKKYGVSTNEKPLEDAIINLKL